MSKESLLIIFGFFVALLPFLGFPGAWKDIMYTVLGICVGLIAFLLRHTRQLHEKSDGADGDAYVENARDVSRQTATPKQKMDEISPTEPKEMRIKRE